MQRRAIMSLPTHPLTMTVSMTPDTANLAGDVRGGTISKLLDQAAHARACRCAGRLAAASSADRVAFRQSIHDGERVIFLASVNHTGNTSMEVGIKAIEEDVRTRRVRRAVSCSFAMVAVVPPRHPGAPGKRCRFEVAGLRRQLRRQLEARSPDLRRSME